MIALGPLECTCWRQFTAQWVDCKKSQIVPFNAIIIIIIIIIIIVLFFDISSNHYNIACLCNETSHGIILRPVVKFSTGK